VREDRRIVGGEGWQEKIKSIIGMEEAPENGKESSHSTYANGMMVTQLTTFVHLYSCNNTHPEDSHNSS
jgi:hypothetical protein